jgi:hypothetical protein
LIKLIGEEMESPVEIFWQKKLQIVKEKLLKNNFDVYIADDTEHARRIFVEEIIPASKPETIGRGGSMTVNAVNIDESVKALDNVKYLNPNDPSVPSEEKPLYRRNGLMTDLFITGTNAVTEDGMLINLDMMGNRIGGLVFGPKYVVVFAGRNKIAENFEDAVKRIKSYAAPANAIRLNKKTPCVETLECQDCQVPDRICNTWVITEKSFPKDRIKVVLINKDLGL